MAARARHILVGYDGSEAAQRALDAAADFAGYGSVLSIASVADGAKASGASTRLLDEARERLLWRHVPARFVEAIGDPAEMLVETARELGADLVVVGRHNHGALKRLVLGSVSASVVRQAPCDVLVVR